MVWFLVIVNTTSIYLFWLMWGEFYTQGRPDIFNPAAVAYLGFVVASVSAYASRSSNFWLKLVKNQSNKVEPLSVSVSVFAANLVAGVLGSVLITLAGILWLINGTVNIWVSGGWG
jgi:hypothetical protein